MSTSKLHAFSSCRPSLSAIGLLAIMSGALCLTPAPASAQDTIDGALWRFQMTSKVGGVIYRGQFRVNNNVLYQRELQTDAEYKKQIGTNHPDGLRTRMVLTDFAAFDGTRARREGLKGEVRIKADKRGEWSGVLIDGDGKHWDFKCQRIQE